MNQNPKQIILQVLDRIGFEDDKEKFANDFLLLCFQQALGNLAKELPSDKQTELTQRMSLISENQVEQLLLEYFPKEKLEEAVKQSSGTLFEEYLQTIIPTLNPDQQEKLGSFLSTPR